MELDHAKTILHSLADGRHPATGEQFPPNSPYQQADTVRALYVALEALEKGTRRREARPVDPTKPKVGASWTPEEEQQLRDAFTAHKPIPEIAAAHGRTQGAITARLMKMGLIQDNATNRAGDGSSPPGRPVSPLPSPRQPTSPPPAEPQKDDFPF